MKKIFLALALVMGVVFEASAQQLMVVHTSDTHSCVDPISVNDIKPEQAGKAGFLRRAACMEELRNRYDNLLLLDCGDFSQGSVYYNLYKGEVEIKLMNEMQYDACTIGNHEFDFGLENMARLFRMAKFPVVCCNYDFSGTPVDGLVKDYIIKEYAGVRVGILGIGPQLEGLVAKDSYGQAKYKDPVEAAQPVVDHLRKQEKCDLVICLSHLGWQDGAGGDADFVARTSGIDLLLGGHSHSYFKAPKYVKNKLGEDIPCDHMGKNGQYLGTFLIDFYSK